MKRMTVQLLVYKSSQTVESATNTLVYKHLNGNLFKLLTDLFLVSIKY